MVGNRLAGKVAIITGANGGIGEATARRFLQEVANLALFLASDESSYCTGGIHMIDGGMTAA